MTKKHFIQLADELRGTRPMLSEFDDEDQYRACYEQWRMNVLMLARFCKRQNPAFKKERWLSYIDGECGPSGGRIK